MKLKILQLNPKKYKGRYSCKYLGFLAVNEDEVLNAITNSYEVYCDVVENTRSCANQDYLPESSELSTQKADSDDGFLIKFI